MNKISCQVLWMKSQASPGPPNTNPNYKLRVLMLKFFIGKMPSGFSNSSLKRRKQWTVCFPIVMREIRSSSWATTRLVFTNKLSYSDPLFCRFFLRPETVHSDTCFAITSNFAWFLTSHFPVVWCFDSLLFSRVRVRVRDSPYTSFVLYNGTEHCQGIFIC